MKTILITGASGLIGSALTTRLLAEGYRLHILTTRPAPYPDIQAVNYFYWQPTAGVIDTDALKGVDSIIHLAGAGVADQRWTAARKKELYDSRILSTRLLIDTIAKSETKINSFICASATGYYGDCGEQWVDETHTPNTDFLATLCVDWEREAMRAESIGIRTVCLRTGIVLSAVGGALPQMVQSIRYGIASYIAQSPLYYPWIHEEDVAGIYIYALTQGLSGVYNMVAPTPVSMKVLIQAYLKTTHSRAWLIPSPPLLFNMMMGEMAQILLSSQRVQADKIVDVGYVFKYSSIADALQAIAAK